MVDISEIDFNSIDKSELKRMEEALSKEKNELIDEALSGDDRRQQRERFRQICAEEQLLYLMQMHPWSEDQLRYHESQYHESVSRMLKNECRLICAFALERSGDAQRFEKWVTEKLPTLIRDVDGLPEGAMHQLVDTIGKRMTELFDTPADQLRSEVSRVTKELGKEYAIAGTND